MWGGHTCPQETETGRIARLLLMSRGREGEASDREKEGKKRRVFRPQGAERHLERYKERQTERQSEKKRQIRGARTWGKQIKQGQIACAASGEVKLGKYLT